MGFGDGSGISWTKCKQSEPRSRQITTATPHQSIFTSPTLFLVPNQQHQVWHIYKVGEPECHEVPLWSQSCRRHYLNDGADISLDMKSDLLPLWTAWWKNWFSAFWLWQIQMPQDRRHKILDARSCNGIEFYKQQTPKNVCIKQIKRRTEKWTATI